MNMKIFLSVGALGNKSEVPNLLYMNIGDLTSDKLQNHNIFDKPNHITSSELKDFKFKKGKLTVTFPPFSVVVNEGNKMVSYENEA